MVIVMKFLTLDHWKPYFWDIKADKFCGTKFEDLVACLLQLEYPGLRSAEKWARTEKSWDGKRDFYQCLSKGDKSLLRWAECKAYQEPITFNILAPTLIMSTLREAGEVLFFSYSRLNREAIKELQEFGAVHQKRILVYDDEKLEELILKYRDHDNFPFYEFFPDLDATRVSVGADAPIDWSMGVYVDRQNCSYSIEKLKKQRLRVNELFELQIFLANRTLSEQTVMVELNLKKDDAYRFLDLQGKDLQVKREISLHGGELASVRFSLKVTNYARKISLPRGRIVCGKQSDPFPEGHFLCDWLLETPYLGDFTQLASDERAISCDYESVLTVFGSSGVGKTRYLRELQGRRFLAGQKFLWSDADHAGGNAITWLKQVLSRLYALPLIRLEEYSSKSLPEVKTRIVTDLLYDNTFLLTQDKHELVAAALLDALRNRNILLIVDNVQNFDDDTIQVLNHVLNLLPDALGAHLLFSFNTDLLYQHEMGRSLFQRIRRLHKDDCIHYPLREIRGLRPGDTELFIKSCFTDLTDPQSRNNQTLLPFIRQIADTAKGNPFYLEQILLHLREEDVLRVERGHLYLFDNRKLPSCLASFSNDMQRLFQQRWHRVRQSNGNQKAKLERIVRFLCFFGVLTSDLLQAFELDEDAIECLVDAGLLRRDAGVTFYHPLLERFFCRQYFSLNKTEAHLCLRALKAYKLDGDYSAQFYICLLRCSNLTPKQADSAIRVLTCNLIPAELVQVYGNTLFSVLGRDGNLPAESPKALLHFYIKYAEQQKRYRTMAEVMDIYKTIYQNYLTRFAVFRRFGKLYFTIVKEYMNAMLTEHHNQAVIELGYSLLEQIDEFSFDDENQRQRVTATLFNRMHVALDRLEPPEPGVPDSPHAQELLKEALRISEVIQNPDGIIQNEIDYGYVFYLFGGSGKDAAQHWMRAVDTWNTHREQVPLWEGGVFFHKAMAHTLLREWTQAKNALNAVFRFHEQTLRNPYYYVKALTLYALILLMEEEPFETVMHTLDEAEDTCTESGYKGIFPVCSHIRGLAYERLRHDNDLAAIYYEKSLTQYIDRFEHPKEEERSVTILITLALALRNLRGVTECPAISRLQSREVKERLVCILDADEDEWERLRAEVPPRGPFYLEDRGINYPCL